MMTPLVGHPDGVQIGDDIHDPPDERGVHGIVVGEHTHVVIPRQADRVAEHSLRGHRRQFPHPFPVQDDQLVRAAVTGPRTRAAVIITGK
jgi:hypothetical protein